MDPYNNTRPNTDIVPADPFEISLTTATNRLEALKRVKLAQDHLREIRARAAQNIARAEADVVAAMTGADKLGAYAITPELQRSDIVRVAS